MSAILHDPWIIREQDFPRSGDLPDQFKFILNYAVLAPSCNNTQPWLFNVFDDSIEIFCDRQRSLPVSDPQDREMMISCGAAMAHLKLALRHFGLSFAVELFPDSRLPDLVARFRIVGRDQTPEPQPSAELFTAIPRRRTYRLPFEPIDVDLRLVDSLRAEARDEGAWLEIADSGPGRLAMADLIEEGDRILAQDKGFRSEIAEWIRPPESETRDGIPPRSRGHNELADRFGPLIKFLMRNLDFGKGKGRRDRLLALSSPLIACLGTPADSHVAWLCAGQALARVLLRARVSGVSASFFTQPIEVPQLRLRLQKLVGVAGVPQMVLRLGYGRDLEPTPRRATDELILHRGPLPEA